MKVIKISAIWCGACLITNKVWKQLKEKYSFDALELDYDMDEEEVKKYSPGEVLPVFLFYSANEELGRLTGEVSFDELEKKYLEVNQ